MSTVATSRRRSLLLVLSGVVGAACVGGKLGSQVEDSHADNQPQALDRDASSEGSAAAPLPVRGDCHAKVSTLAIPFTGPSSALVQADGTTLVSGVHVPGNTPLVARVLANGTLDSSFGPGGVIMGSPQGPFSPSANTGSGNVALWRASAGPAIATFILTDYNRDVVYPGAFDAAPNDGGTIPAPVGPQFKSAGFAISPALARFRSGFALLYWAPQLTLLRLRDDLTSDPSFGTGGTLVLPTTLPKAGFTWIAVTEDSQGRVLVGADDFTHLTITRLLPTGALDPSFGAGGVYTYDDSVFTTPNVFSFGLAVDGTDRPLLTLMGRWHDTDGLTTHTAILRLDAAGTLDASFGNGGVVRPDVFPELGLLAVVEQVFPQADGTTVLHGAAAGDVDGGATTSPKGFFARLDPNGGLDPSFGAGGLCMLDFDGVPDVSGDTLVLAGTSPMQTVDGWTYAGSPVLARIDLPLH